MLGSCTRAASTGVQFARTASVANECEYTWYAQGKLPLVNESVATSYTARSRMRLPPASRIKTINIRTIFWSSLAIVRWRPVIIDLIWGYIQLSSESNHKHPFPCPVDLEQHFKSAALPLVLYSLMVLQADSKPALRHRLPYQRQQPNHRNLPS